MHNRNRSNNRTETATRVFIHISYNKGSDSELQVLQYPPIHPTGTGSLFAAEVSEISFWVGLKIIPYDLVTSARSFHRLPPLL